MSDIIMGICPKCAWFKGRRVCDFCGEQLIDTETTLEEVMKMTDKEEEELVNHYIETLIKDTYDPKAREYREANERPVFAGYVHDPLPKCPTCQSTNISKIGTLNRMASVGFLGLASSKIGKTHKCNSCGHTW